ncbi:SulP family inorganic anion transporter [Tateyamaria pelophila]|uniref:SulP family inorganic anion transporter n=1 Tax=Tateyamaria pelophila TaxID=328415 RepID=UPI001CC08FAD|nr:SulP family inorganic anion transporter [Tateyamaria pelophila]
MQTGLKTELKENLRGPVVVPSITAGLVAGVLTVTFMFSYSAVIFTGELSGFVPRATGQLLFGGVVIALVIGLFSELRGVVALPQDNPTAIIAVMIATLSQLPGSALSPEMLFAQAVVIMVVSTALSGVIFYLVGRWRLAAFVQLIPYPVIAGFLAATGWLLFKGSFSVMADQTFDFTQLSALGEVMHLWLPGAVFALITLFVSLKYSNVFIMPGLILSAVALFHITLFLSGASSQEAIAEGWLLQPFGEGALWKPVPLSTFLAADWTLFVTEFTGLATILSIALISVLLNLTALESAFNRDIDVHREMRLAGIANLLAAPGGSLVGYHYVSLSTLGRRMRGDSRLVGVVVAVFCLLTMTVGAGALSVFPKFVLGGLVMFIGLGFLYDWVVKSWSNLGRGDVAIIFTILFVVEFIGFLEGVATGVAAAVVLFVVSYSKLNVVRLAMDGSDFSSNVDRPDDHRKALSSEGQKILYLKLHGFIFFASSIKLYEEVVGALTREAGPPEFVILDFQLVSGLDTSAVHGLVKIKKKALEVGTQLALAHVPAEIDQQLHEEEFLDGDAVIEPIFKDADSALEWCEDFLLRTAGVDPSPKALPIDDRLIEVFKAKAVVQKFRSYLETTEFSQGDVVSQPGIKQRLLHFIEQGTVSIYLDELDGEKHRIRGAGPGSMVGVASFFRQGNVGTLAVGIADSKGTAHVLTDVAFERMKSEDPDLALKFQTYALEYVSERLASNLRTLSLILRLEE